MATTTYDTNTVNNQGGGQTTVYTPAQPITPSGSSPTAVTSPTNVTPTPPSTTPVIPVSTLTSTRGLTLPPAQTSSGVAPANAVMGIAQGQAALLNTTDAGAQNATDSYNNQKNQVSSQIDQYLQKGTDQLKMETAAGIPGMRSDAAQLATQLNTQQLAYNAQYNAIFNNPNATMEQKANQISTLQQQHGYDLTDTSIRSALAQTNYTNAQNLVNHQIDIKYAPMKDAIDYGMQFLAQNKDILTTKQAQSFQANLAVQQQMYTQSVYYDHLLSDTKVQMVKDAASLGAPADVQNAIWNAQDIGTAAAAGGSYLQNNSYSVVQTGIDQETGLPIYSKLNPKSGQMEPLNYNGALGVQGNNDSGPAGTVVNGYQFGASTTLGAYASNTQQQVNNIKATVAKIDATVGPITSVETAQTALSTVAPKSPITGAMVMAAANQYGVDPSTIIGVMQAETQCGTDGSKGSQECNWGNVGNTDSLMASGKSVKMTPQQGVDAIAKNLSLRKVQAGQSDPAQPPAGQDTLSPLQQSQMAVKNAPQLLQPAMATPNASGIMFIDMSKVPTNLQVMAQSYAAKTGIKVLSGDQADLVRGAQQAADTILNVVAPAWQDIAPQGTWGKIGNGLISKTAGVFNTDTYSKNKTFLANKESVAQQVKTLSESAAKAGLIAIAETAQPNNAGYFSDPSVTTDTGYDTLKQGNDKMQQTLNILNEAVAKYVPNAQPYKLPTVSTAQPATLQMNGSNYKLGTDGLYHQAQ